MFRVLSRLGLIALPAVALMHLYRRPVPKKSGKQKLKGLRAPVEVLHDRWGVPHIYAQNLDDLLFAQGYVHAQDRLWQMELNRHLGHGRLAEIVGEAAVAADRVLRGVGLARAAHATLATLDTATRHTLEAYAAGVNAGIAAGKSHLPLELSLLGHTPEPWQPLDTLVWAKVMAWSLSFSWPSELMRAALVDKLGPERAVQLEGDYPDANPLILPDQTAAPLASRLLEQLAQVRQWLPVPGLTGMSNNWVVAGTKSVTQAPLLANDPHLPAQVPGIWYESHLVSPDLQVAGVSMPGAPGIIIGHNAHIAWGITAAMVDTQDLYVERFHPDDPSLYQYQGSWEKATIIREEIRVKGQTEPRIVDVTTTRHGPVISDLVRLPGMPEISAISLRWTGHEATNLMQALMQLDCARNWDEFTAALGQWSEPALNFVYADRQGNIGYQLAGRIPIRAQGLGVVPVPGWTDAYEWTGWIAHEELPRVFNPAQDFLATANNQVTGQEYSHLLTAAPANGFRARRIVDLLTAKAQLSAADFARMQTDQYCIPARPFCELLSALAPRILEEPTLASRRAQAEAALAELGRWDYVLASKSVAGAIYEVLKYYAVQRLFRPWLGGLTDYYCGIGPDPLLAPTLFPYIDHSPLILQRFLDEDRSEWFKSDEGETLRREAILALALGDTIDYLAESCGPQIAGWQWGRIHQVQFHHALGVGKALDGFFSRGPYAYGGDGNTVWQGGFIPTMPIKPDRALTASWRQIIDLNDWDASLGILPPGQSGHQASRHYSDMIGLWLKGEYHPLLWSRPLVEKHSRARLMLVPDGEPEIAVDQPAPAEANR